MEVTCAKQWKIIILGGSERRNIEENLQSTISHLHYLQTLKMDTKLFKILEEVTKSDFILSTVIRNHILTIRKESMNNVSLFH